MYQTHINVNNSEGKLRFLGIC